MKYKILFVLILLITTVAVSKKVSVLRQNSEINEGSVKALSTQQETTKINQDEFKAGRSDPERLIIPSLDVDSQVEIVGKDSKGRMDVPKADMNIGWWKFGAVPGEPGNAVIAGHYDTKTGSPAVFFELENIQVGDEVVTVNKDGVRQTFEVYKLQKYEDDEFPLDLVFGGSDNKNLNLITCAGEFDSSSKNYSDRLVVFSRLKT